MQVRIITFFTYFLKWFKGFSWEINFLSVCQCNQNMAACKWRGLTIAQTVSETWLYGILLYIKNSKKFLNQSLQYFSESSLYKNISSLLFLCSFNIFKNLMLPIKLFVFVLVIFTNYLSIIPLSLPYRK